jgi:hypothetical protein
MAPPASPFTIQLDGTKTPQTEDNLQLRVDCGNSTVIPDTVAWHFGDGRIATISKSLVISQSFRWAKTYQVSVQLFSSSDPNFYGAAAISLQVAPGSGLKQVLRAARALRTNEWLVRAAALLLATLTGVIALYADKPFGTLTDYCIAILWGFGIEKSVRGFGGVVTALGIKSS